MDWRVAESLLKWREQVNAKFPGRSTASDGSIGDAAHASRSSDHNPWFKDAKGQPVVSAMDITHDPAHGVDTYRMAEELRQSRDPRIKYVISNGRIFSSTQDPWVWRKYTGSNNMHTHHVHISVKGIQKFYDDPSPWHIPMLEGTETTTPPPPIVEEKDPTLKEIQAELNKGGFGPITADGLMGPQTRKAILRAIKAHEPLERRA